jgi:hypothetical protein
LPKEEEVKKPWKFAIGGVYKKTANSKTYYGVLHKASKSNAGVVKGFITAEGLQDELVTHDEAQDWEHVRGGVEV